MRMLGAVAVSLLGCGGQVVGKLDGNSLNVAEVAFVLHRGEPSVSVWLSDQLGLCSQIGKNQLIRNSNMLSLNLVLVTDDNRETNALEPGSYPMHPRAPLQGPGRYGQARFHNNDDRCADTLVTERAFGEVGAIEITAFDQTRRAAGTFDVTFGSGDRLTGSFDAPLCDVELSEGTPSCE